MLQKLNRGFIFGVFILPTRTYLSTDSINLNCRYEYLKYEVVKLCKLDMQNGVAINLVMHFYPRQKYIILYCTTMINSFSH